MSKFHVILQFWQDGPTVSGEWTDVKTAERKFLSWVGTYASEDTTIRLDEESADGHRRVVKT